MSPRDEARAYALARVGIGALLLLVPRLMLRGWVGPRLASSGALHMLGRVVGVRDLIMGGIALHTVDHPEVGPRWAATCAAADAVDAAATYAARDALPATAWGVFGVAAGGAVTGVAVAQRLKAAAPSAAAPPA